MLRRRIAALCLLLPLSLAGCQKPPATDTTTPDDATASTTETETKAPDPADAPLPAAQEVLAKSIDAVGGAAAIEAIESSYTEATTEIKAQGLRIVTRIWAKGKDFYVESDMPGVGVSQVWKKGDEIWSTDPINGTRKLEGKEAAQARWSSDPMLAANWNEYFDEAKTVGRSQDGERWLLEVKLSTEAGDELVLLFDEQTFMPAGQAFEQQTPMGELPIRITVSDYREVAGVKFPFRSVTDMQLMSAVQTTQTLDVNVEIDDAKFEPPTNAAKKDEPAPASATDESTKDKAGKGKGKAGKGKTAKPKS